MGRNPASITPMAPVTPRPTRPAANPNTSSVGGVAYGSIKIGLNYETVKPWHRWWAWRPVTTVGGERVWLKWCHRRIIRGKYTWPSNTRTEYGTMFDVIRSAED